MAFLMYDMNTFDNRLIWDYLVPTENGNILDCPHHISISHCWAWLKWIAVSLSHWFALLLQIAPRYIHSSSPFIVAAWLNEYSSLLLCWEHRREIGNLDSDSIRRNFHFIFGMCFEGNVAMCCIYYQFLYKANWLFLVCFFSCYLFQPCFMHSFSMWLGFQSSSEYMLQSLYLMCKGKHHKSQKHSSVFSNDSLNHSEDEKAADTSLFGWVQNRSYLALDSSDFWLIYQAVSVQLKDCGQGRYSAALSLCVMCAFCQKPWVWLHVQSTLYPACLHDKYMRWYPVMTQSCHFNTNSESLRRTILKCDYRTNIISMHKKLNWQLVEDILLYVLYALLQLMGILIQ